MTDKLNARTRALILTSLCEGVSERSCERIFGVEQNTVAKLLADAGDMAISFMRRAEGLAIQNIQADELYSFIGAKEVNLDKMDRPRWDAGTIWTYLAVCAKTKLIFNYHLGRRGTPDAEAFMRTTAAKLKREPDGGFTVRPTIITDGLRAYQEAISTVFGADADHGVYLKRYSSVGKDGRQLLRKRYVGADRVVQQGFINDEHIHTAYVERQNLNVRMRNRRFGRRTNGFSKTLEHHERQLALTLVYGNYCLIPRPVRRLDENGKPLLDERGKPLPWIKRLTPAMEAGITDYVWDVEHLLELTDAFKAETKALARRAKKG